MKRYFLLVLFLGTLMILSGCIDSAHVKSPPESSGTPEISYVGVEPTCSNSENEGSVKLIVIEPNSTGSPAPVPGTLGVIDPNLLGTWYLGDIQHRILGGGGNAPGLLFNSRYMLTFDKNGYFSGFGGCSYFSGRYNLTGREGIPGYEEITIGPIASIRNSCEGTTADNEITYLRIFQNAEGYDIYPASYDGVNQDAFLVISDRTNDSSVYNTILFTRSTSQLTSG